MEQYMYHPDCFSWSGYKPCRPIKSGETQSCDGCVLYSPILGNYLIIEAGGLGSVLRSTVVSKEIKKDFPNAKVQWLTHERGKELLQNISSVDTVLTVVELMRIQDDNPLPNLTFTGNEHSISKFISIVDNVSLVVSVDTFGLHAAIARNKYVVSIHGPQPEQEIYLYGRGRKLSLNLDCAPCFAARQNRCVNTQSLQCVTYISVASVRDAISAEMYSMYT